MIYSVSGYISEINPNFVVINTANQIGFQIYISSRDYDKFKDEPTKTDDVKQWITFYTILHLKETHTELVGFSQKIDKDIYNVLLSVSGIGTKAALALLSELTAEEIIYAIQNKKDKVLTRAKGIGKKAAVRIVMDAKLSDNILNNIELNAIPKEKVEFVSENIINAIEALVSLGYKKTTVKEFFKDKDLDLSTEELIKIFLKECKKDKK